MDKVFSFPDTVNEHSARQVATGVVIATLAYAISGSGILLVAIALGFAARVFTGPTLSPLGQFVTRVVTPAVERLTGRVGPTVTGTPKRFAQAIGASLSAIAVLLHFTGFTTAAVVAALAITIAATLESVLGYCLGCKIFGQLMAMGIIPAAVCVECNDISARLARAS